MDFNRKLNEEKRICVNYTYKLVLARMDEYDCSVENPREIKIDFDDIGQRDFIAEDDQKKLNEMRGKVKADTDEIRRLEKKERKKEDEKEGISKKADDIEWRTKQLKAKYEAELKALKGREPEIEYYYKEVSRDGFWGRIKDIFKGKEKRKYSDDSKHRQWETDMERLRRNYYCEIKKKNDERESLKSIEKKILGEGQITSG